MSSSKITTRTPSFRKFLVDSHLASYNSMANSLNNLALNHLNKKSIGSKDGHTDNSEVIEQLTLIQEELDQFLKLFERYLKSKSDSPLNWSQVKDLPKDYFVDYHKLTIDSHHPLITSDSPDNVGSNVDSQMTIRENLAKLAVLKLNGGLGTTMGCSGPKSALEVRDGMTFLDLIVRQIESLNREYNSDVPLILMNSFNTNAETHQIIQKYSNHRLNIQTFNQSRFPRIYKDSLLPVPTSLEDSGSTWYPPGHGDLIFSLIKTGLLDNLLDQGYEMLFVSNVDNLGATVDLKILNYMIHTNTEFLMEVTEKTRADIKGGTLVSYNDQIQLLELAQVPSEHVKEFTSLSKFHVFNTNNIWINLRALKDRFSDKLPELDIIINQKRLQCGKPVIQLETAIGAAIKHFDHVASINVPRTRFFPVKSTADLFLIHSNIFTITNGHLEYNPTRQGRPLPLIKLGDNFKKVNDYLERIESPPDILDLDHLTINGDVTIGRNTTLRGTVIIVAKNGCHIDIPNRAHLVDKVVTGELWISDH